MLNAFPLQQRLREIASILRYTYAATLFIIVCIRKKICAILLSALCNYSVDFVVLAMGYFKLIHM